MSSSTDQQDKYLGLIPRWFTLVHTYLAFKALTDALSMGFQSLLSGESSNRLGEIAKGVLIKTLDSHRANEVIN